MGLTVKTIFSGLPAIGNHGTEVENKVGKYTEPTPQARGREADEHSSREAEMQIGVLQLRPETMQINDLCGSDYHSYISTC